jgi:hypothetical protein
MNKTNTPSSILKSGSGLLLLLAAISILSWLPARQARNRQLQAAVAALRSARGDCQSRITQNTAELASVTEQLRQLRAQSKESLSRAGKLKQELLAAGPENMWATPPASPLEWDPDSPYIWLRKDSLSDLPITCFAANGELLPQVATVLCVEPATQQAINTQLRELLTQYHALEVANAEPWSDHLPGESAGDKKVSIRIKPLEDQGSGLKQQFANLLRNDLGEQRANLILQSTDWFDSRDNGLASEPKIYTAARTTDGRYRVTVKSASSWFSTSGFKNLGDYVPAHLLPMFSELTGAAPAAAANSGGPLGD